MKFVLTVVLLFFGLMGLFMFWQEWVGKQRARKVKAQVGRVAEVRLAQRERPSDGRRYEVEICFDVPGHGRRSRVQAFASRSGAEAFAQGFVLGSTRPVKLDSTSSTAVFLSGEEGRVNPTPLLAGLGFLAFLVFFWMVD